MVSKQAYAESGHVESVAEVSHLKQQSRESIRVQQLGVMMLRQRLLGAAPVLSIDASVAFRLDRDLLVPHQPGVYLIHDLRGVLYVGRSIDLRRRFDEHFWHCDNPLLATALARPIGELQFSWCLIGLPEQVAYEKQLVNFFNPPCNRTLYVMHALAVDRRPVSDNML